MADVALATQTPGGAGGVAVTYKTSGSAKDPLTTTDAFKFPNSGKEFVLVKKGVGALTMTVATPRTVDGLAVADRDVTVPANTDRLIGPFDPAVYNDSDGEVSLTFDSVATLSVAVIRI